MTDTLDRHAIYNRLLPILDKQYAVDQMDDRDRRITANRGQQLPVEIFLESLWQRDIKPPQRSPHRLDLFENVCVKPRSARITDILFPLCDVEECFWQQSAGAKEIYLEHAHVVARSTIVEHVLKRRVGYKSAIPIRLSIDCDWRKAGRQRATRHDVVRRNCFQRRIEVPHIAGANLHGADTEPDMSCIQKFKIDKLQETGSQRRGIVDADRGRCAWRIEECRRKAGRKETGRSGSGHESGTGFIENPSRSVVSRERTGR